MIRDEVLHGRVPRLGTLTVGYGVEATSQQGRSYSRPTRASTLVFHSDDPEVATAVQTRFGGDVSTDSPTWGYDVITDVREVPCQVLPAGFRQALEAWRAAECLRRCDGVVMSTQAGKPGSWPCVCETEMTDGNPRLCTPSTVLPVFVDLDCPRFGVWEVRSGSWGTAANLKGAMAALGMVGAASGAVPAVLSMHDRQVRDASGQVRDVVELRLTVAVSHQALAAGTQALSDPRRADVEARWQEVRDAASEAGVIDRLRAEWQTRHGSATPADLSTDELAAWVDHAADVVRE